MLAHFGSRRIRAWQLLSPRPDLNWLTRGRGVRRGVREGSELHYISHGKSRMMSQCLDLPDYQNRFYQNLPRGGGDEIDLEILCFTLPDRAANAT